MRECVNYKCTGCRSSQCVATSVISYLGRIEPINCLGRIEPIRTLSYAAEQLEHANKLAKEKLQKAINNYFEGENMEDKKIKVRCIKNPKYIYETITIGNEYAVLNETELTYKIMADNSHEKYYPKDCFEKVERQKYNKKIEYEAEYNKLKADYEELKLENESLKVKLDKEKSESANYFIRWGESESKVRKQKETIDSLMLINDKYMEGNKNKDAIIEKAYKDNKNLREAIKNMVEVL
jgi:hypothetical protein